MSDDDIPSSASIIRKAWEYFPAYVNILVILFILIGGLFFAGQRLGFYLDNQNLKHQQQTVKIKNSIVQNQPNVQQGYVQAVSNDVTSMDNYIVESQGAPNQAMMITEALGIGNQACLEASYLTGSYDVSAQMQNWINTNCSGGALKPSAIASIRAGKGN